MKKHLILAIFPALASCGLAGIGDPFSYEKSVDEFTSEEVSSAFATVVSDGDPDAVMEVELVCTKPANEDVDPFRHTSISFKLTDSEGNPKEYDDINIRFDQAPPPQGDFLIENDISEYYNVSEHWYSNLAVLMLNDDQERISALTYLQGGGLIGAFTSAMLGGAQKSPEEITHDLISAALSAEEMQIRYQTAGGVITTSRLAIDGNNYRHVLEDCGWQSWLDDWNRTHSSEGQSDRSATNSPSEAGQAVESAAADQALGEDRRDENSTVSPSFDCSRASSSSEVMVCGSNRLARLDSDLAEAYRNALRDASSSSARTLRSEQRAWINGNNRCQNESCLEQRYRRRISDLEIWAAEALAVDSWDAAEEAAADAAIAAEWPDKGVPAE